MSSWDSWLRFMMCKVFQSMGRVCTDLSGPMPDTVSTFHAAALAEGRPTFNTPAEAAEFDAWLTAMEAHLNLPDNTLTAAQDNLMRQAIAVLQGNPP